jgi:hypothetical protein
MSLRKRLAVLLSALSMMMVLSVPPVMAHSHDEGNKRADGPDFNKGGGQETPKNPLRKNGQLED